MHRTVLCVKAGEPVHEMILGITIGVDFMIRDARAESVVVPYAGHCDAVTPSYAKLKGMTLGPGFMREIKQLFGKTQGCTDLTELIGAVAAAAFQTMKRGNQFERPYTAVSTRWM